MEDRNLRKSRVGVVISDKMDKTVVVEIRRTYRHPLVGKVVHDFKRVKAHDENNQCNIGDRVEVMETRPISKDKRWRLVKVIEQAK